MAEMRKAHVIRLRNTPGGLPLADGTPSDQVASSDDIWIDVMRIDECLLTMPNAQSGPPTQNVVHKLKWLDAPGDHPNTARKLKTIKITNPNDNSQWVKVDIIERATITHPNAKSGPPTQNFRHVFKNGDTNDFRKVDPVTVYHTDVSSVDMTKGPVDWFKTYKPALIAGGQDKTQSLDVEIPKRFTLTKPNAQSGPPTQDFRYVMKNQEVEDAINQKPSSP
jgi:hypothetical protein